MYRIKDARLKLGLSQAAFGALLGIPKRTIENWESGNTSCPEYVRNLILFRLQNAPLLCPHCGKKI